MSQREDQRDLIMMIVGYSIKTCLTKTCGYKRVIFIHLYTHTRRGDVLVGTNEMSLYKNVCRSWMMDFKQGLQMLICSNMCFLILCGGVFYKVQLVRFVS